MEPGISVKKPGKLIPPQKKKTSKKPHKTGIAWKLNFKMEWQP